MQLFSILLSALALTPLAVLAQTSIGDEITQKVETAEQVSSEAAVDQAFNGMAMSMNHGMCPACVDIVAKITMLVDEIRAEEDRRQLLLSPAEKDNQRELCATGSSVWDDCLDYKDWFNGHLQTLFMVFPDCAACNGLRALQESSSVVVDRSDSTFVSVDDMAATDGFNMNSRNLEDNTIPEACNVIGEAVWAILKAADYKCYDCLQEEDASGTCLLEYS